MRVTKKQARDLFQRANPSDRNTTSTLDHREFILKIMARALGCLVASAEDHQLLDGFPEWGRIRNAEALYRLHSLGHNDERPIAHALGVHFVDEVSGRVSNIWGTPNAVQTGGAANGVSPGLFWDLYCKLWMRTYWRARRTSVTLLSAFHEKLIQPNGQSVIIRWNGEKRPAAVGTEIVDVNLPATDPFVVQSRALAGEFDQLLAKTITREVDAVFAEQNQAHEAESQSQVGQPRYILRRTSVGIEWSNDAWAYEKDMLKNRIEDAALEVLTSSCVVGRLEGVRTDYAYRVLTDQHARQSFASLLRTVSPALDVTSLLSHPDVREQEIRHHPEWNRVLHVIEALQSAILNEPRFCSPNGLFIGTWGNESNASDQLGVLRLVICSKDNTQTQLLQRICTLSHSVQTLLTAANNQLVRRERDGRRPQGLEATPPVGVSMTLLEDTLRLLRRGKVLIPDRGIRKWIGMVHGLARSAVHEEENLSFWVGCGPAYVPTVQGYVYALAPSHLADDSSSVEQVVHYVKAYFSLFGRKGRILWFDKEGRFRGVFEGETRDPSGNWVIGSGEGVKRCCFAVIRGKNKLDFRDWENNLLARVSENAVSEPEIRSELRRQLTAACSRVFRAARPWAASLESILDELVLRLRDEAHGAGLVVSNGLPSQPPLERLETWRRPIAEQVNSLAPPLGRLDPPVVASNTGKLAPREIDLAVASIAPLALLDGAVWITVDRTGMWAKPARQFIPLVDRKPQNKDPHRITLFDLVEWSRTWEETQRRSKVSTESHIRGLNTLLGKRAAIKKIEHTQLLAAIIQGVVSIPEGEEFEYVRRIAGDLVFLNSAGTRHHSLWGISLTTQEKVLVVSISQDGHVRVFWSGRVERSPGDAS